MKYNTGTVAVTNGSPNLVGTNTKWATNVAPGQLFTVTDSGVSYQVASVTDDTHLVLSSNYVVPSGGGTTGLTYTIIQGFTSILGIPYPDIGDVQTATILKRAILQIETLFSDYLSGRLIGQTLDVTSGAVTLVNGLNSIANKTGAILVLNLPPAPQDGDYVALTDAYRSASGAAGAGTYNWHVFSQGGVLLEGALPYLTLDMNAEKLKLHYNGTRNTWEEWV